MPTLAGLLGAVDSVVTPAKRKLADLLANPVDSWQQMQGGLLDDTRRLDALYKTAGDGRRLDAQGSVMGGLPQYKQAQQQQLSGLLNVMPVGATVWHGSPHKFDKFDASKIGTGEGAQAYGHGLYLAESPGVANSYKEALSQPEIFKNGRQVKTGDGTPMDVAKAWLQDVYDRGFFNSKTANPFDQAIKEFEAAPVRNKEAVREALLKLRNSGVTMDKGGSLYKVDLPDEHIAKMLDWDKPLSQQPWKVQDGVHEALLDSGIPKEIANHIVNNKTGRDALATIGRGTYDTRLLPPDGAASAKTSSILKSKGIPGIRYLDGGSRDVGQGTSNFVVFPGNEGLLSILERNGIPVK